MRIRRYPMVPINRAPAIGTFVVRRADYERPLIPVSVGESTGVIAGVESLTLWLDSSGEFNLDALRGARMVVVRPV